MLLHTCIFLVALVPALAQFENLAQRLGTASMIDSFYTHTGAGLAIDGNTNGKYTSHGDHSVAISRSTGVGAWWKVTFPQPVYIDNIVIYHRTDCCMSRYENAKVLVDGNEVGVMLNAEAITTISGVNRNGREVQINGAPQSDGFIQLAEVQVWGLEEDVKCYDSDGNEYRGRESYTDEDGKTCICGVTGIVCRCEGENISCPAGSYRWTDQDTCVAQCIRNPAYCSSSGDPHYRSFDGRYYDFHGKCTYQAASCGDFKVNFKNIDFYNRAPRFTLRAELIFKGITYTIANQYKAEVNGNSVQVPYIKTFTNGDTVRIVNNGQLEIILTQPSKGRNPAVLIRAVNARTYINAEIWLHGSCADLTEGLCGNFNADPNDDLTGGSPNSLGTLHQLYDESCPAPPNPYHPCNLLPGAKEEASRVCDDLKTAPFTDCHSTIPIGNEDGGVYGNCMTDVCNCLLDRSCACSQYDNYASSCIDAGVDLSNWRASVDYCPFDCPDGQVYQSAGSMPAPTCLDREPEETGTTRGCFCPQGQFLQDGVCVSANDCKCLYEGVFYDPGDEIKKEGECQQCTCMEAGEMTCTSLTCDVPTCAQDEILASRDDLCCPYCESEWVDALNPEETIAQGQEVTFTCQVNTKVASQDIIWTKDGEEISEGVSEDGLRLKISDATADDEGQYTCTATKGESSNAANFYLSVEMPPPQLPSITFEPAQSSFTCKAKKKCKISFTVSKEDGKVDKKGVKLCKLVELTIGDCKKMKFKKKGKQFIAKLKRVKEADSGAYVCVVGKGDNEVMSDPVTITVE